ncbi:DUF7694 domain-containing protein [Bradyrhizobium sp. USDA 4473]
MACSLCRGRADANSKSVDQFDLAGSTSLSRAPRRCPNWEEMCFVKDLFWNEEECVMQLHPPHSQYVNNSRYCLHLWKPTHRDIPMPPASFVGIVGLEPSEAAIVFARLSAMA